MTVPINRMTRCDGISIWEYSIILLIRLSSVFIVKTSFVPDEYWQSMEVAHKMAFGYGYLTWEWKLGIRSALYPIVIGSLFKFLQVFGMDSRTLVILAPRVLQAFISSIGDIFILKFAKLRCGPEVARWTLFAVMSSWFLFYCASRTIINSVETVLTNVSLYYFPWNIILKTNQDNKPIVRSYIKFLVTVAFGVIMRPTAAAFWMPLCLLLLWKLRRNTAIWQTSFAVGFSAILLCIAVDRVFYHRWIFTPFKFFHFNLWTDQSRIYGTHPWHWYITQGFPILMGVHLIPFLLQIKNTKLWWLLPIIAWNMIIFSFVAHKEFRFLMPILPMALVIVGEYFASNIRNGKTSRKWKCIKIVALLMVSVPHTLYFSIVHQRGTLDVMDGLHSVAQQNSEILFLLPCHSTPLYSHLHRNVSARFLTCEPNLNGVEGYVDEADVFYQDPSGWLETEFLVAGTENIPTHLVLFDSLSEIVDFEWVWDNMTKSAATVLACNDREVCFHTKFSSGTAAVKGCQAMRNRQYYWEIKMTSPVYGTDMMIGVGTGDIDLNKSRYLFHSLLGSDCDSWALSYMGTVHHQGQSRHYSTRFGQGSIIGVHLDLWHGTLSFYSNRKPLGIAYRNLHGKTLFPMVSSTAARSKMKVVRSCSFASSLQYLCCLKLRQAVPADRAVIDVVPLPPGLKNYLCNNLDWLMCTKSVASLAPPQQQQPSRTLYSKRRLSGRVSDHVSDSDDEVVLSDRQRKRSKVL